MQSPFGSAGPLTLTVSASTSCGGSNGPFSHIFVTITDVQLNTDPNAVPGNPSFVDLTPGLRNNPAQIDLLGTPNQCFLSNLGSNLQLPAGSYAQIRVFLAADGTILTGNQCGSAANCVTLKGDLLNTPHAIQLGTETTQGIQIASDKIAGGAFTVSGSSQVLNLNFDGCASVVALGNNQFRFRPVLVAGDAGAAISGQLVDSATTLPVPNGQFTVALEQADSRGVDRVFMETAADAQGNFSFCPVTTGTFDVVASGLRTDTVATYAATATTSVQAGNNLGAVPMTAVPGVPNTAAIVLGMANSSNVSFAPTSADVTISALQLDNPLGGFTSLTIPLLQSPASTTTVPTQLGLCAPNTDCAAFNLVLPPANPMVGVFNPAGTSYSQSSGLVMYNIEGTALVPLSGATPDCSPSFQAVPVIVTAGNTVDTTNQPLSFTQCQ